MNRKKQIKPIVPIIGSLLLALILFFLTEDFLKTVIITPLLYLIWFVSLIIDSLPYGVIWAGLIFVLLLLSINSIKSKRSRKKPSELSSAPNRGPVEKWVFLLRNAQDIKFSRWLLASELKRLTRRLLTPNAELGERKNTLDDLQLPPELSTYFNAQQPTTNSNWNRVHEETERALGLDPEIVIQYLEKQQRL